MEKANRLSWGAGPVSEQRSTTRSLRLVSRASRIYVCILLAGALTLAILGRGYDGCFKLHRPSLAGLERRPVVDLGYARYEGILNQTTQITIFLGIRYAAAPVGEFLSTFCDNLQVLAFLLACS